MRAALDWVRRAFFGAPQENPPLETPASFERAVQHYKAVLATRSLNPKSVNNKVSALRYLEAVFDGRTVDSIRPFEVARLVREIHNAGKQVTSRQVLSVARDIFNEVLLEGWNDINPALHVKRPQAPVRRRRLTLDQFLAIHDYLRAHAPPWAPVSLRLALVTAQRRSDLVRMRSEDVHDGHLFVDQHKTGARIAIPLALRLDALNCTVGDVVEEALRYQPLDNSLLLRTAARPGRRLHPQTVTFRFWKARVALGVHTGPGDPPSLHEIRSLSERLYRAQGVDTQTLLGHRRPQMTDLYNDDRGLTARQWKYVPLPGGDRLPQ